MALTFIDLPVWMWRRLDRFELCAVSIINRSEGGGVCDFVCGVCLCVFSPTLPLQHTHTEDLFNLEGCESQYRSYLIPIMQEGVV